MSTKKRSDRHNARCFAPSFRQSEKKTRNDEEPTNDENAEEKDECSKNSEGETEEGNSSNTDCDQDSEIPFTGDTDVVIDITEIEEDWIEYMKRSTRLPEEKMMTANISCWIMTHKDEIEIGNEDCFSARDKKVKTKLKKWNPCLSSGCKASRAIERPRERWEDDINQFPKPEETEETKGNDLKNNDTSKWVAKYQLR